jgi:hypothetical protein
VAGCEVVGWDDNRERRLVHDAAGELFHAVLEHARNVHLMSSEHCIVGGRLIDAQS